jgi:hypothetical protein
VSVMWAGCSGRHLGEVRHVMNLDPGALRLAQFLVKLCRANQLIYVDAAAAVIEQELINNRASNLAAQKKFANVAKFSTIFNSSVWTIWTKCRHHPATESPSERCNRADCDGALYLIWP